jgi:hypothetical protein
MSKIDVIESINIVDTRRRKTSQPYPTCKQEMSIHLSVAMFS